MHARRAAPAPRPIDPNNRLTITAMTAGHWPEVRDIYAKGIATGDATFETEPPDWATWDAHHLAAHRFVVTDEAGEILGWAAVSAVSGRCVYAGVVEGSVYVAPRAQGRGVGTRLLQRVLDSTEAAGIWTVEASVFPENTASIALHHRLGFRTVGTRRRLGQLRGRWRDVVLLERRSERIG